jgi:hypothetical protein
MNMRTVVLGLVLAGSVAWITQNPDVASMVDETVTLTPKTATVNAANTGLAVNRSGYHGAMLYMQTGVVDNVALIGYLTLQDSIAGGAWTVADSVLVDSVDNRGYEINYKGVKPFLRAVQRATQAAGDSLWQSGSIILTGKRSR